MCNYPGCKKEAVIDFALVNLCKEHYMIIYNESLNFYQYNISTRHHFEKIKKFIPEKKKVVREEDVYGTDCRSGSCEI